MPWLQFFDDENNLLREYECSRGAKIMMDQGGTIILDEAAIDTPTNPRVLMLQKNTYTYAKTISDSERDRLLGQRAQVVDGEPRMIVERAPLEKPQTSTE